MSTGPERDAMDAPNDELPVPVEFIDTGEQIRLILPEPKKRRGCGLIAIYGTQYDHSGSQIDPRP